MKRFFFYCCLVYFIFSAFCVFADPSDSSKKKLSYPNNIKINLTSIIEYFPSLVIVYERSITPHQTFSVQAGYVAFPQLLEGSLTNITVVEKTSQSGFRVGGDFRFYFKNENKYNAPRGLYWGPFIDYFSFKNSRTISIADTSFAQGNVDFTGKLKIAAAGVQLGYQFVIKKRFSIDLNLFGPALAYYGASLKLDGNFDVNEENKYLQILYDDLISRFPVIGDLISNQEVKSSGRADFFFAGFRYSASVGFRF